MQNTEENDDFKGNLPNNSSSPGRIDEIQMKISEITEYKEPVNVDPDKEIIIVQLSQPFDTLEKIDVVDKDTIEPLTENKRETILPKIDILEIFEDSEMKTILRTGESISQTVFKIEKKARREEGIYIKGNINGIPTILTVDTGAARTVLSEDVYLRIPEENRPHLVQSSLLIGADGNPLRELGIANFNVKLGNFCFNKELVVADIADPVLLGLDVLLNHGKVPAEIRLSDKVLLWNNENIPFEFVSKVNRIRNVIVVEDTVIPGNSELILDVHVEKTDLDSWFSEQEFLIEPSLPFMEKSSLVMATCLVDLTDSVTGKVRLMNPYEDDVLIHQNTVIGIAQLNEDEVIPFMTIEENSENEEFRYSRVRRLPFQKTQEFKPNFRDTITKEVTKIRPDPKPNINKDSTLESDKVPKVAPHLEEIFKKIKEGRNIEEVKEIASLLNDFKDVFSKNEEDIGLTNLIEHSIDTGNAKPIKQPPRRVPIAFADKEKEIVQQMERQGIIRKSTSP